MTWDLKKFFNKETETASASKNAGEPIPQFKIIVADFYDNASSNGAINLATALNNCEGLDVSAYTEDFDHSFLNLESRNIFDLIDTGNTILQQKQADTIIWGYRDKGSIRLNFQSPYQYEDKGNTFISLMDSFYLPAEFLDGPSAQISADLLLLLYGAIISSVNPTEREKQIYKKYLLKKISYQLSQIDSLQSLEEIYLPYVLNLLGVIYLSLAYDSQHGDDFKIINDLFTNALQHQNQILHPTHLGCIYNHLGQLYDCATHYQNRPSSYFRNSIKNYRQAQKYLSKYTYPYDYGYICYKLSNLYVNYWKQTEDIQALRDAVFQMREAEKVYTQTLFPSFWAYIQGALGYLLHNIAHLTKSDELYNLAIDAYQNQQKIITEKKDPLSWGYIQEKIGHIYYLQGRKNNNISILEEALSCFHDALFIYENAQILPYIKQTKIDIEKAHRLLTELKEKEQEEREQEEKDYDE
ncbi:MAG: hypothetical protein J6Y53_02680 [Alphaproteobacteria bacterium]|nr:hypothetical protein [Alphaproteobacteria bacterium]